MGRSDQGVSASRGRYRVIPRVLVFVFNGADVLLLKGAPDKRIWAGLYNGVGGHVEADEDVFSAARRELCEETGLEVDDLRLCGIANIDPGADPEGERTGIMMFVFSARSAERRVRASAEGVLEWAPAARLPERAMVPDLPVLLEHVLGLGDGAAPFFAHYRYDDQERLQITFSESGASTRS